MGDNWGEDVKRSPLLAPASPEVGADGLLAAEELGGHQDGMPGGCSSSKLQAAPRQTQGLA